MNPFRPPTPDTPQWKDAFRLSITSYRACPNERLIVVLGINGRQGASVAKAFRRDPGWRIRGLTSELNSEMSKRWESCGVEVQKVDTNDLASMITAFRGASAVFAVTDYYKHLDDHSVHTLASLTSKSREEVAGDRDYQAQHVILQAAAVTTTLMRLILSSLPDASGIYPTLRGRQQMLSKKAVAKSIWTTYPHLAVKTAIVEPCLRMEDFRVTYRREDSETFSFGTTAPPWARLPWIHMTKDFGVIVRALILHVPPGYKVAAVSTWISGLEICKAITEITGTKCKYRQYRPEELDPVTGKVMADLIEWVPDFSFWENNVQLPSQFEYHYGFKIRMTDFEEYLAVELRPEEQPEQDDFGMLVDLDQSE